MLACLLALLLPSAQAATVPPPAQTQAIEAAQSTLGNAPLSDAQREAAKTQLDAALALEKETEPLITQLEELHQHSQASLAEPVNPLSAAERQSQFAQWTERLPKSLGTAALERLLQEERQASEALKARIDTATSDLTLLIARPGQRLDQIAALRQRADASAGEPAADADEPAALFEARRLRRAAEHRRALAELAVYEAEQNTAEARQHQLEAQLLALHQEQSLRAPRIEWLTQRINRSNEQRLLNQAQEQQAVLTAHSTPETAAPVRTLAQRNADLANQLVQDTQALGQEQNALGDYERQREQTATMLRDTQARLRLGSSSAIGYWLWQQRLAMPSLLALNAQRKDVQRRLGALRLALYNAAEERYALGLQEHAGTGPAPTSPTPAASAPSDANAGNTAAADTKDATAPDTAAALSTLQTTQINLNTQYEQLLRQRIAVLEQTDATLQTLLSRGNELLQLMDRQLLWAPSHPPIGSQWFTQWQRQASDIATVPATLGRTLHFLLADLRADPLPYLALSLLLLALLTLRLRAPRHLRALSLRIGDAAQDHFSLTLQALLWTLLTALPAAATVFGLGLALQEVGARHLNELEAIGNTLLAIAPWLLLSGLWGAIVQPGGLAQAHFHWAPRQIQALRRAHRVFVALVLPIAFVALLTLHSSSGSVSSTWGRLALVVLALSLAALTWPLLRRLWPRQGSMPVVLRLLHWLLPMAFIAVALLALGGYVYTGNELLNALLASLTVALAVMVIDGLLRRWLLLSGRRLARKRMLEHSSEAGPPVDSEAGQPLPESDPPQLTLGHINAQSHRLLRLLRLTLLSLGLLWAWASVLPALLRLDGLILWRTTTTGAEGPITTPITLMDVLVGLLLLLLTFSMTRNLPGLLELLLSSSRVSNATRYTATTLLRYAITIAGALAAFSLFGLRWGQLQWMAAALTVGLGFGLQEIFANFVSGLILLVERPFRVGDTITTGTNLTGTVTRIRTRATTVLDSDNREIVIPNKTFITGQVTNWTLSDTVTRLTLTVGAGYGSDPEQVRQLLLRAAREHPAVLAEPPPSAWFTELGSSTLDFELRVYVAALIERMPVRNDLNRRIVELLEEAGIAIAFPQMDIHLRDLPAPANLANPTGPAVQTPTAPATPAPPATPG